MISDVHQQWHNLKIPECDLLISAGDYSYRGVEKIVFDFHKWLNDQPAKHIISVQGNHELWVESNFPLAKEIAEKACPRVKFIDEGPLEIEGIKIWCSAVQPEFYNWAWNVPRGEQIRKHWDRIPAGIELLVTHGPPYGILDTAYDDGEHLGCEQLNIAVCALYKLKLHIFGHIHGGSGIKKYEFPMHETTFVNASICNEQYKPVNPVREFIWPKK